MEAEDSMMKDLKDRIKSNEKHKRSNRFWVSICYLAAIFGSLFATVSAAANFLPNWALALVNAVPATALLLVKVFRFDLKEQWHHDKVYGLSKFMDKLKRSTKEPKALEELQGEINKFDEELRKKHPNYGAMPQDLA